MNKNRNFCFNNNSGVTRSIVIVMACGLALSSFFAGYFVATAANRSFESTDPIINDLVRPGSIRALRK